MTVSLGIDTGGTYTDAVLLAQDTGAVLASAKALTTYDDLSRGIAAAVAGVLEGWGGDPARIGLASLSTTLATNAIVEGQGARVALLLLGYDRRLIERYGFGPRLVTKDVVYVAGGHDSRGDEQAPLDEEAVRLSVRARLGRVEALAVSGYFSVRNPAHEQRAKAIIEAESAAHGAPLPVTCGHELTTRLDSVRRATTAALNARLIPLLRDLVATVRAALDAQGIAAPLMVVRGDGSLVRAGWALRRPIETILSGPAASVVGARHLAGARDGWVVDVGGTTTDIAGMQAGRPRRHPEGAHVGGWRTMIEAVDVHTVGLGGDSLVYAGERGEMQIGPRRAIPLSLLAAQHPHIVDALRGGAEADPALAGQFLVAVQPGAPGLTDAERELVAMLRGGPRSLADLAAGLGLGALSLRRAKALEARRVVMRAGFTPTDALHVLGRFTRWDVEAARLGAALVGRTLGVGGRTLCEQVVAGVAARISREVLTKALADEGAAPDWSADRAGAALVARALGQNGASEVGVALTLRRPLIVIGAPAAAYAPQAAAALHTECVIPAGAEVANAVGAAVGGVAQQARATIRPLNGGERYRLFWPEGVADFPSVEQAVAHAEQTVPPWLERQAREAGTAQVEVHTTRLDEGAPVASGWGEQIYLGTELTFTALGRPAAAPLTAEPDTQPQEG